MEIHGAVVAAAGTSTTGWVVGYTIGIVIVLVVVALVVPILMLVLSNPGSLSWPSSRRYAIRLSMSSDDMRKRGIVKPSSFPTGSIP